MKRSMANRFSASCIALIVCVGVTSLWCQELPNAGDANKKNLPDFKKLLPSLKPLSPQQALKSFRVEKGFQVELVAAEPAVTDPIAMTFDADGRLYVAEMRDYPFAAKKGKKPIGRVRLLEDTNNDGLYDKSTIFADHVHWPSGIACWKGGVYVSAPPQILYLKDSDGDGKADIREVVYDGFGTATAEDIMNNLKWGMDNWIYGASSYNGGEVSQSGSKLPPISVRGRDFRFHPKTRTFQPLAGTGDFGNCFDDWGNRFVANAGNLLMHPVLPGPYLDRNPFLSVPGVMHRCSASKKTMASISPPEPWRVVRKKFWKLWVNTSHDMRASRFSERELAIGGYVTGGAGPVIYRGSAFPGNYQGNSFTAEPAGNVVIRLNVIRKGATFDACAFTTNREFLASTDNWFRPVNMANGPDGCLYVLDMYREIIEDPSAIPKDILKVVDVTNGRNHGRIYRIRPDKVQRPSLPKLGSLPSTKLVSFLEHKNSWQRETAQRLLFERQDKSIVKAVRLLASNSKLPQARLHALWTLHGLGELDDDGLLVALGDTFPVVRKHAVRLSESRLQTSPKLLKRVIGLVNDHDPQVRLQVAFSLGEAKSSREVRSTLVTLLARNSSDPWIPAAVLSSVQGDSAADFLHEMLNDSDFLKSTNAGSLANQVAYFVGANKNTKHISAVLKTCVEPTLSDRPELQQHVVSGLADGLLHSSLSLSTVLEKGGKRWELLQRLVGKLIVSAKQTVADKNQSLATRLQAVRFLGHADYRESSPLLTSLLHAAQPVDIQLAAIRTLSRYQHPQVAALLIAQWQGMSPRCHNETLEALFRDENRINQLLLALKTRQIPIGIMDSTRLQFLRSHKNDKIRAQAKTILPIVRNSARQPVIERYATTVGGQANAERGKILFAKHCSGCHHFAGQGKRVGPDLTGIQGKSAEQLLIAILDPNREVAPNYRTYTVSTKSGKLLSGIVAKESLHSITLRRAEATEDTILRNEVEVLVSSGLSLMPEGFEKQLTPQQMNDLLTFLQSRN